MKNFTNTRFFKFTSFFAFLFLFGFVQQVEAQAQPLTVFNNTNCWIVMGEHAGDNCNICNQTNGTWVAPNSQVQFPFPPCITATLTGSWIGIKYAVGFSPSVTSVGATSYTPNPFNPTGPCFSPQDNSFCGNQIFPQWFGGNFVLFQ